MRILLRGICSLAIGYGLLAAAESKTVPPGGFAKNILTNHGVVLLAQAGYSEGFIIEMIHLKQTQFDVTPEALAALAHEGLSERIVRVMVANERKDGEFAIIPAMVSLAAPATTNTRFKNRQRPPEF